MIALVGANGAGKSTLMSIVAGLLPASSGEVLVGGRRVNARHGGRPADTAQRVAILAQDKPLYREFTVADMLTFGQRTNRVWDQRRALSWLDRFDVPLGRRCGRLSGGQRAQVALAVADLPPCPGEIVQAQHIGRQSTFIVRLPGHPVPPAVAPGWSGAPMTLEELTLAYLKASAKPRRVLEAAV